MNLDFLVYFDWIFYIVLGLAVLMGFLRGMKKTLFTLITMAIFYVVFFITVIPVSKLLWTMQMPWLGGMLANIDPSFESFTSFDESIVDILQFALGDQIDLTNPSEELMALVIGIGQFALKIVYTLLYFTVILLIYKIVCWILGAIIIGKRTKGESKNRGFGALIGLGNGIMAVFITLIMLGGIMSVTGSVLDLMPESGGGSESDLAFGYRDNLYQVSQPIIVLDADLLPGEEDGLAMLEDVKEMVDQYNNNFFVKLANNIQTTSLADPEEKVPLNINLFDRVLSFEYADHTVAMRYELEILSDVAVIFMTSKFVETNEISDLTGEEIRLMFAGIGKSNLIISIMPLAIELGAEYYDQQLPISRTELYEIDFQTELPVVGEIAGSLFDILNGADVISGGGDVQDIVIDGDFARDLFTDMSDSEVVVLLIEALVEPMLEDEESEIGNIIKIPAELDWSEELVAIGLVLGEILDQDLTFADIASGNSDVLLEAAASVDIDTILSSGLITETLINILRGDAGIEGMDFLEVPAGLVWLDDDNHGELRNILVALQVLLEELDGLDMESVGLDTVANLDDEDIDKLFDSDVIVATISKMLMEQDFGDTPIVIPDSVMTLQDYIEKSEMKALAKAIKMIVVEIGTETDFDIQSALNMTDAEIATFLDSEIIAATVGKLVMDLEVEMLVIPDEIVETIEEDGLDIDVVKATEIADLLSALTILDIADFDSMTFDATIIDKFVDVEDTSRLDDDLISRFLASKIIHASASSMIFDLDDFDSSLLSVPTLGPTGDPIIITTGSTQYIDSDELGALFQALYVIDIDDFNGIDLEDTALLFDNMSVFLDSAILHATISNQILSIDPAMLVVPYEDGNSVPGPIRITQAETEYIDATEIQHFVDAVRQLGFDNPTNFDTEFTLTLLDEEQEQDLLLLSAIIHATISDKILGFGDSILVVPEHDYTETVTIRYETGPVGNLTEYIAKSEIKYIIDALGILEFDSIDNFSGTLGLGNLFASQNPTGYEDNQNDLLASASLHATISKQLLDLSDAILIVPDTDTDEIPIRKTVDTTNYVKKEEIKAIIDGIDVVTGGLLDAVDNLDGVFTLDNLADSEDQDTLLSSTSLHATISARLFEVNPSILQVPAEDQDSQEVTFSVGPVGFDIDYVTKDEIKAIINALNAMDYPDLDSFTAEFDLSEIVSNASTILLSATIQKMFSDRLMNDTGNVLVIPNKYYGTVDDLRIITLNHGEQYIEYSELVNLVASLEILGLTTITDTWSFGASSVLAITDYTTLLLSEIVQATISDNILPYVKSENEAPTVQDLIVPELFRQVINVGLATETQVEKTELGSLLTSLKMLGISAFGDSMNATDITAIFMDPGDRNTFLSSGSIHITLDNMIKENPDISASIPVLAQETAYGINDVTTKDEITRFILAANTLATAMASGDDFTEISFTFAGLLSLSETDQGIILDSMIVRNKITPETELFCQNPLDPYLLVATDYEEDNMAYFLRKLTFESIITHYDTP